MKSTDRFLTGIVVGVIFLVGVAVVVAVARPEPTYQSDATPEGVVHNYLLALHNGDFGRAYDYLSPSLDGYPPSVDVFADDVFDQVQYFDQNAQSSSVTVESARVAGDRATVTVRRSFFSRGGLFDSGEHYSTFEMRLRLENGRWRLTGSGSSWGNYWLRCWEDADGCD